MGLLGSLYALAHRISPGSSGAGPRVLATMREPTARCIATDEPG